MLYRQVCLLLLACTVAATPAASGDDFVVRGSILSFVCGDNCYLLIETADDSEVAALCTAPVCRTWIAANAIPDELIGAALVVNVGAAIQYDGGGNPTGAFPAFTDIRIGPPTERLNGG